MENLFDRTSLLDAILLRLSIMQECLKWHSNRGENGACKTAEDVVARFLAALCGWELVNLNTIKKNYPAADLGDHKQRLAIQVTVNGTPEKVRETHAKATTHNLGDDFDRLIILFLLPNAPGDPKASSTFSPCTSPLIEKWARPQLDFLIDGCSTKKLRKVLAVLENEMSSITAILEPTRHHRPANLPYASLGTLFKGRDAFLTCLRERLANHAATLIKGHAIHGLGGVGKTRSAVEYALRYGAHYTALLFVAADSPATMDTKLAALCHADVLNLPARKLTDQSEQKAAVLVWLNAHPGWLLILDNADSEDALAAVDQLLPRLAGGHVLITSRLTDYAGGIDTMTLDVLSDEDATAFLIERTDGHRTTAPDDDARALELVRELGGLALALEQVAAHIRKERLSFANYLELWHHSTAEALHWYNARTMHYPRSLAVTYQTSVDRLSEPAKEFFRVLSWLAPDPIPFSALDSEHAPTDARSLLAELENFSLARRDTASNAFTVHRLVQEITRQQQLAEASTPALLIALLWFSELFLIGDSQDVSTWPVLEPIAGHIRSVALHAAERDISAPTAFILNHVAVLYYTKAQYAVAEPLYRHSLALYETFLGSDHSHAASTFNNLATLLLTTNRLVEAEPLFRKALAIWETTLVEGDPRIITAINNLAQLLKATNRLAEAEPLMRHSLAMSESAFGKDHPQVAASLNNLAQLLRITNRDSEAEQLMRQALAIDQAAFGPDHPKVAIRLNNLATLLLATNRLTEAESFLRKTLTIWESSFGNEDPHVASALNNLAQVLQATDRIAEAEPLMRRALAIDEVAYGTDHPAVAIELHNLARLLQATNRLAEAEPLMWRMLIILAKFTLSTGHEHPNLHAAFTSFLKFREEMGESRAQAEEKINEILLHTVIHNGNKS